jgi:nucleotide-binding universal stress UspA family protein
MRQFRRILYASDFSPASRPAFRRALALARANRAVLTIAHVYSIQIPAMGAGYVGGAQLYDRMLADIETDARRRLDRLVTQARKSGVSAKGLLLEGIPPYDRIVRAARSTRADSFSAVSPGVSSRSPPARS